MHVNMNLSDASILPCRNKEEELEKVHNKAVQEGIQKAKKTFGRRNGDVMPVNLNFWI